MYIGRFAPTPSGPLHLGSIITAIASYLDAKSNQGKWLLKIDDVDQPRVMKDADSLILDALQQLNLHWDGEVIYQSDRLELYQEQINLLSKLKKTYLCECSRKELKKTSSSGDQRRVYPGTCREKKIVTKNATSYRVIVDKHLIEAQDYFEGLIKQDLNQEVGDFIIKRSDGLFSYQFAVVIDNYLDKITDIVRGSDLIHSLPRQIYLHQLLGFPAPRFCHIPVATKHQKKLSKGHGDKINVKGNEISIWLKCLKFLNQPTEKLSGSMNLNEIIEEAINTWSKKRISSCQQIEIDGSINT